MSEPFSAQDFLSAYHKDEGRLRKYLRIMETEWKPYISQQIKAMSGSEQDVDDVFQESLYELVANLGSGNFKGKSTLRTYFTTICKYKWMGRLRKDTRREEIRQEVFRSEGVTEPGDELVSYGDLQSLLGQLLDDLGSKCKQVLTLWAEGIPYDQIVQQLDTSNQATARKRKHDCIERLIAIVTAKPGLKQQLFEYLTAE